MTWSTTDALRRLAAINAGVPKFIGLGTQSATISGFVGYARDMAVVQSITTDVLTAATAPRPDREYGDDGYRDHVRAEAAAALTWGEAWLAWRNRCGWSSGSACKRGESPWEAPDAD